MENPPKLGVLIEEGAYRDAIHIAVAPVYAGEWLTPGMHIGFLNGGENVVGKSAEKKIGVVDPFLKRGVHKGERFYMLLYPNSITGLRHEWTHPEFSTATPEPVRSMSESEKWLRDLCKNMYVSYEELVTAAKNNNTGGYIIIREHDTPSELYDDETRKKALYHLSVVLNERIDENTHFSCSC